MRVLVLGSGGREHALAWKLRQSPLLSELTCAPGNPGMASLGFLVQVDLGSPADVLRVARERRAELVVVGPELPLVNGAADLLQENSFRVFGPVQAAAKLEGSKAFAKEVMQAAKVPTASFKVFQNCEEALSHARSLERVVVKADGLAAGKGVVVAGNADEACAAIQELWSLGPAGKTLVLEEVLEGEEVSLIALCDGERYVLLPAAQDHKRLEEGDAGPNTGGMGAYAPVSKVSAQELERLGEIIIRPVLREMATRGAPFRGALYAGLMLTRDGPKVLEFNCRLGDPEAQVLLMQLDEDLLPLLLSCAEGQLSPHPLRIHAGVTVGVVMAAHGYPGRVRQGDVIRGAELRSEVGCVFHAGTSLKDGQLVTSGGRVVTLCARGDTLAQARERAYGMVERIHFEGRQFRRDIAFRGL